jgi:hypothetical protein
MNMQYQWFVNGTAIVGATNPTLVYTPQEGTHTFYFVAMQLGSECSVTSNIVTVIVDPIPDAPGLTINPTMICSGDPVTISGNIQGSYVWYRNGSVFTTNSMPTIVDQPTANNVLTTYTYTATVQVNNCTSVISAPVSVVVHPTFDVQVFGAHQVCEQAVGGEILTLHAILYEQQPGVTYQYIWTYVQGLNPAVQFFSDINNPYAAVPNNLPVNDAAAPY